MTWLIMTNNDLDYMFLPLLFGHQQQIDIGHLLIYEQFHLDEHNYLQKTKKSSLVKRLGMVATAPDSSVVDVSQLFYHTVWPHGGNLFDLIFSFKGRISSRSCEYLTHIKTL